MAQKGAIRPPAKPQEKRIHTVAVRMGDEMLERLREMADRERRQPANMAFVLLEEAIAAREKKAEKD